MPKLSDTELQQAVSGMPGWSVENGEVTRQFKFKDFVEALGFIAQVGALQEQMDHHATITNTYSDVKLALSTHSEGGITEKDIELARKVSERAGDARQ
jgi:4a-hydroxytetrahydrobiopterin dehydratase